MTGQQQFISSVTDWAASQPHHEILNRHEQIPKHLTEVIRQKIGFKNDKQEKKESPGRSSRPFTWNRHPAPFG
jgi:hypothetical protein